MSTARLVVVRAVDGGRVVRGARYVAAFQRASRAVSIQQVKIPVCRGGVYTQREVPESDGNRLHGAPGATPICTGEQHIASSNDPREFHKCCVHMEADAYNHAYAAQN